MLAHMQQTTIAGGFPPARHIHIKRVHQTGSLWRSCLLAAVISDGQICVSSVSAPEKLGPLLRTVGRIPLWESLLLHLDTALRWIKPWVNSMPYFYPSYLLLPQKAGITD